MTVEHDPTFGCALWQGKRDRDGYGRDGFRQAHIIAWEEAFGPVPEGFVLDHACSRRNCVALHHLEPVTQSENLYRRDWGVRSRRAKCPKGHDMKVNAIVTPEGGRVCRTCNQEAKR